jgi:flagellar basal body-associated protein FliL
MLISTFIVLAVFILNLLSVELPVRRGYLYLGAGGFALLITLILMVTRPYYYEGVSLSWDVSGESRTPAIGAYLALVVAIIIIVAGVLQLRRRSDLPSPLSRFLERQRRLPEKIQADDTYVAENDVIVVGATTPPPQQGTPQPLVMNTGSAGQMEDSGPVKRTKRQWSALIKHDRQKGAEGSVTGQKITSEGSPEDKAPKSSRTLKRSLGIAGIVLFLVGICIAIVFLVSGNKVGSLIGDFNNEKEQVRNKAEAELVKTGKPAVPQLIEALQTKDKAKQTDKEQEAHLIHDTYILETLGKIGDSSAVKPIVGILKKDEPSVKELRAQTPAGENGVTDNIISQWNKKIDAAFGALRKLKDPTSIDAMLGMLNTTYDSTFFTSTPKDVLVVIGEPTIAPLIAAMKAKPDIRYSAGNVLTLIGAASAGPLSQCLGDGDADMRKAAAVALMSISPEVATPYTESLKGVVAENYAYFIKEGIKGSEHFLAAALNASNNVAMAVDFLNCGNETLKGEATNWATSHGYTVVQTGTSTSGPQWGG